MFHHVSLEIPAAGADAEVACWELLGLTEVPTHPSLAGRARWLQTGDGSRHQVHLLLVDDPVVPADGHPAIVLADYEAAVAAVRAGGIEVRDHTPYWDSPRALVRTPAGHRVEVMAFAPRA